MKSIVFKAALWSNLFVGLLHLSAFAAVVIMDYPFEGSDFTVKQWCVQLFFSVVLIVASIRPKKNERLKKYSKITAVFALSFLVIFDSVNAIIYSKYSGWFEWIMLIFFFCWTLLNVYATTRRKEDRDRDTHN